MLQKVPRYGKNAFRGTFHFSRIIAHFPEVLLTFSKINKVRYFYQTFLFQIFNYTNLILNQLLYNSILSIFNICILSTYYNKCALKSSSLISVKYAGAISNTVLHPFWPFIIKTFCSSCISD